MDIACSCYRGIYEVFFSSAAGLVVASSLLFSAPAAGTGASFCFVPCACPITVVAASISSERMPAHASCQEAMETLPKGARGNEMIHSA